MSKAQILAIVTFLVAMLFVGMAQADCSAYYYLGPSGCCKCSSYCRRCYGPSKCHPDYCDRGYTYNNGLCIKVVVNAASRLGVFGALAAVGTALAAAVAY